MARASFGRHRISSFHAEPVIMVNYRMLFWDLDGTLTDPKDGITRSVQYALDCLGVPPRDSEELTRFIGPPLMESFQKICALSAADARRAVAFYRERFEATGIFENALYPGIPELLRDLQADDVRMAVATSKLVPFAERILVHFGIRGRFEAVFGAELDGRRERKLDVLTHAVRSCEPLSRPVAMIGDHMLDIEAANACGLESIAAIYGYGSATDLEASAPTHLASDVAALRTILFA